MDIGFQGGLHLDYLSKTGESNLARCLGILPGFDQDMMGII
jgi:hypothetical protein